MISDRDRSSAGCHGPIRPVLVKAAAGTRSSGGSPVMAGSLPVAMNCIVARQPSRHVFSTVPSRDPQPHGRSLQLYVRRPW